MRKRQENCACASALHITLRAVLTLISAGLLLVTSFNLARADAKEDSGPTNGPAIVEARSTFAPARADRPVRGTTGAPMAPDAFTFTNTGSLGTGRYFHTATLLPSGK